MIRTFVAFFLLIIQSFTCYCQTDTIKIDAPVSLLLESKLTAADVKTGDTVMAFTVTDDVYVNNGKLLVIKRGAAVKCFVSSSLMPYKIKQKEKRVHDEESWYYKSPTYSGQCAGELSLQFVEVQAVDGTFLPLNNCTIAVNGGVDGGNKNDKIMAAVPAATRRICQTRYPYAILVIKK
ncbi:MAG TPA: hypothetical protein VK174_14995 [Chitinophagales bacterium]|nr:hypothetical protein [Chitinophagales bacterium]